LFTGSFFTQFWAHGTDSTLWSKVPVNLYSLIDSLFGISAVFITFGALIGKVSPLQLIIITLIELALHALNAKCLMEGLMQVDDLGGTYAEHMFGAYFGLACAYALGKPSGSPVMGTVPDLFSLIGTLFLWIYWPSFVSGAAEPNSPGQEVALVNTILSLSASTIITFCLSNLFTHDGRFRPVDIQNATLAGGVAIGCSANLLTTPFGSILIGLIAGSVSCYGFNFIQPNLEKNFGLHDSCGIHNLHAMPSVIGALASIFVAGPTMWFRQFFSIIVCVGFAVAAGFLTGYLVKPLGGHDDGKTEIPEFHDQIYWEVAEDYNVDVASEVDKHNKHKHIQHGHHDHHAHHKPHAQDKHNHNVH